MFIAGISSKLCQAQNEENVSLQSPNAYLTLMAANMDIEDIIVKNREKDMAEQQIRESAFKDMYLIGDNRKQHPQEEIVVLSSRSSTSHSDIVWLERIVMAEAGGEPYEGQIAVANVVLNRLYAPGYPKTLKGVIFDRWQFTPATTGEIYDKEPSAQVKQAVREALEGKRVVGKDVLYFLNPDIATDDIILRSKTFVKRIGDHAFYK